MLLCRVRDLQDVKFTQRAALGGPGGSQKRAGLRGHDRYGFCLLLPYGRLNSCCNFCEERWMMKGTPRYADVCNHQGDCWVLQ